MVSYCPTINRGKVVPTHGEPKYLGGDPNGPLAIIPAPFHQLITNAFRDLAPYGSGDIGTKAALEIARQVYEIYNLELAQLDCAAGY